MSALKALSWRFPIAVSPFNNMTSAFLNYRFFGGVPGCGNQKYSFAADRNAKKQQLEGSNFEMLGHPSSKSSC
jgi:hypothetical protein